MAIAVLNEEKLLAFLQKDLEARVNTEAERLVEEMKLELEKRMKAKLAEFAMSLLTYYSVERRDKNIVITVRDIRQTTEGEK